MTYTTYQYTLAIAPKVSASLSIMVSKIGKEWEGRYHPRASIGKAGLKSLPPFLKIVFAVYRVSDIDVNHNIYYNTTWFLTGTRFLYPVD